MLTIDEITNVSNTKLIEKKAANKNINHVNKVSLSFIFCLIGVLIIVLTFIRIPFSSVYLDGCIDYVFGIRKYCCYLFVIFILLSLINKKIKNKVLYILKKILPLIIMLFFTIENVATCMWLLTLIRNNNVLDFQKIINAYHESWHNYFFNANNYSWSQNFIHQPTKGGIISIAFCSFLYVHSIWLLVLICGLVLLVIIFLLFCFLYKNGQIIKKIKKIIAERFNKQLNHDIYDEFNTTTTTLKWKNSFSKIKRKLNRKNYNHHIIDFLPKTNFNYDELNRKKVIFYQKRIIDFFKVNNITFFESSIKCYHSFLEITFKVEHKSINHIIQSHYQLQKLLETDVFNFAIKGNIVSFQLEPQHFSPLSLHSFFHHLPSIKTYDVAVGVTLDETPIKQNLLTTNNVLLLGKKQSGSATALVTMILSLMFTTSQQNIDFDFVGIGLDPVYEKIWQCKLFNCQLITKDNAIKSYFQEINLEIEKWQNTLKIQNVDNIHQYNKKIANDSLSKKLRVIVLPRLELIFETNNEIYKLLHNILKFGPQIGIYCFMQAREANDMVISDDLLTTLSHLYLFKIDDIKISYKLLGNDRAIHLFNWGDCLAFSKPLFKNYSHIQTCYISRNELSYNLNILKIANSKNNKEKNN